ncbi:MAG TPA: hypothetical protein VIV06_04170 [Candidatus Limnocylindrales bacterium]
MDELLRRADVAMYHAKARGKNRYTPYAPEMDREDGATTGRFRSPAPAA